MNSSYSTVGVPTLAFCVAPFIERVNQTAIPYIKRHKLEKIAQFKLVEQRQLNVLK